MSAGLKEKIAQAIKAARHEGDENDAADAVMAVLREQEPLFWFRPVCNGEMYEEPIHNNSVEGKALRGEIPGEWKPLYPDPVPPAESAAPDGWRNGVEAVAQMIQQKADDYAQRFGHDDMGRLSFGQGAHAHAKLEYHSDLCELAEEARAMLAAAPKPEDE